MAYGIEEKWGWKSTLAEKLGLKQPAVSGWDSRGVPESIITKVSRDKNIPVRWLELGEGEMLADQFPHGTDKFKQFTASKTEENKHQANDSQSAIWEISKEIPELTNTEIALITNYRQLEPEAQLHISEQVVLALGDSIRRRQSLGIRGGEYDVTEKKSG